MANDVTDSPFIIDTAGPGDIVSYSFRVRGIRWVGATTAGHTVSITDSNDVVKWESEAAGANHTEADTIADEKLWKGLRVPTLASGKLYIEVW